VYHNDARTDGPKACLCSGAGFFVTRKGEGNCAANCTFLPFFEQLVTVLVTLFLLAKRPAHSRGVYLTHRFRRLVNGLGKAAQAAFPVNAKNTFLNEVRPSNFT